MKIRNYILLALLLFLSACASTPHPEGKPLPAITFQNLQPLPVNVRSIKVVEQKKAYSRDFVISPDEAMRNYLSSRFAAQGSRDSLRAIINEASVISYEKDAKGRVIKYLGIAGHDVYDVKIRLTLEHITDSGQVLYSRSLTAQRTMSITEHASVAEREKHQFISMEKMFMQLDKAIVNIVFHEMKIGSSSFNLISSHG